MMHKRSELLMFVALSSLAVAASAAVSADEAKQLGVTITPWGAEKAGNKDGTIPAYTGEGVKAPADYDPVKEPGLRKDPWNEKPLFTITAQNAAQYADKLDGMIQLFKIYPEYRMDIYPTHRTATFPKYVQDNSIKNATSCKGTDADELVLQGCYGGIPFPIPKTGTQAMWNHSLQYDTLSDESKQLVWVVPPSSDPILVSGQHTVEERPFYNPKKTGTNTPNELIWRVRSDNLMPARKVGEKIVLFDYVNAIGSRRAWQYIPGQRRVKLAPDLSYDTPGPWQGGYATMDDGSVFLGPIDRFNWKLVGKKEKFIEYNSYKGYNDPQACPPATMTSTKHFPNPVCSRWELHRVWVVEGTIKPQYRHIYKKRILYWDEDSFCGGGAEMFDASGKLFRYSHNFFIPFYNGEGQKCGATYYLDLNTGGYATAGTGGMTGKFGWWPNKDPALMTDSYYSPEALAAEGIR